MLIRIIKKIYKRFWLVEKDVAMQKKISQALRGKQVFFIQIGANDGVRKDPLHLIINSNLHWRGIFVEPIKYIFERLVSNYGDGNDRFIYENVAIGSQNGINKFYYVDKLAKIELGDELSNSWEQYGSFYKQHLVDGLGEKVNPYIREEDIPCTTLDAIFIKHKVQSIDLVYIDVEGFDYKVLCQIDFSRMSPRVIVYEHSHLSQKEYQEARELLFVKGYSLEEFSGDTLAILTG